jgi:hypothetical protein
MMKHSLDEARAAKHAIATRLAGMREVNGIGLTEIDDDYAVQVYLSKPVSQGVIPKQEGTVPVKVEVIGRSSTDW